MQLSENALRWPVTFKRREKLLLRWQKMMSTFSLDMKSFVSSFILLLVAYQAETKFQVQVKVRLRVTRDSLIMPKQLPFQCFLSSSCQFKRKMIILRGSNYVRIAGGITNAMLRSCLIFERTRNWITEFHFRLIPYFVELEIEWNFNKKCNFWDFLGKYARKWIQNWIKVQTNWMKQFLSQI